MEKITFYCNRDITDNITFDVEKDKLFITAQENEYEGIGVILNLSNVIELRDYLNKAIEEMKED